mgnify:FL=1|jgi:hypothetical protein|tara:strand:+ start:571 stop:774 length:204 start_codon:yes stop_codon:yes gene_type:complete
MKLKLLVNNMEIWNSFNDELDRRLNHVHIQMEQTIKQEDLFRLQGEAKALRRLKFLRDEVNGPKPDQ